MPSSFFSSVGQQVINNGASGGSFANVANTGISTGTSYLSQSAGGFGIGEKVSGMSGGLVGDSTVNGAITNGTGKLGNLASNKASSLIGGDGQGIGNPTGNISNPFAGIGGSKNPTSAVPSTSGIPSDPLAGSNNLQNPDIPNTEVPEVPEVPEVKVPEVAAPEVPEKIELLNGNDLIHEGKRFDGTVKNLRAQAYKVTIDEIGEFETNRISNVSEIEFKYSYDSVQEGGSRPSYSAFSRRKYNPKFRLQHPKSELVPNLRRWANHGAEDKRSISITYYRNSVKRAGDEVYVLNFYDCFVTEQEIESVERNSVKILHYRYTIQSSRSEIKLPNKSSGSSVSNKKTSEVGPDAEMDNNINNESAAFNDNNLPLPPPNPEPGALPPTPNAGVVPGSMPNAPNGAMPNAPVVAATAPTVPTKQKKPEISRSSVSWRTFGIGIGSMLGSLAGMKILNKYVFKREVFGPTTRSLIAMGAYAGATVGSTRYYYNNYNVSRYYGSSSRFSGTSSYDGRMYDSDGDMNTY